MSSQLGSGECVLPQFSSPWRTCEKSEGCHFAQNIQAWTVYVVFLSGNIITGQTDLRVQDGLVA